MAERHAVVRPDAFVVDFSPPLDTDGRYRSGRCVESWDTGTTEVKWRDGTTSIVRTETLCVDDRRSVG